MLFSSSGGHSNYVEHKRMINSTMTVCCQIKTKQSLKKHIQDRQSRKKEIKEESRIKGGVHHDKMAFVRGWEI